MSKLDDLHNELKDLLEVQVIVDNNIKKVRLKIAYIVWEGVEMFQPMYHYNKLVYFGGFRGSSPIVWNEKHEENGETYFRDSSYVDFNDCTFTKE